MPATNQTPTIQTTTIEEVLKTIDAKAGDNLSAKGTLFEDFVVKVLPHQKDYNIQTATRWKDWDNRQATTGKDAKDIGIDIIAHDTDGNLVAIQCKNFNPNTSVQKSDIDSFLNESSTDTYHHRIIIATTEKYGTNAQSTIHKKGQKSVQLITLSDLDQWQIPADWQGKTTPPAKKTPHPYQAEAIAQSTTHYQTESRGQLIMACGTGKTYTSLKIAERLAGTQNYLVLFLMPSLSLVKQTLREWAMNAQNRITPFVVCSDTTINKRHKDEEDITADLLQVPITTNARHLVNAYRSATSKGIRVIFSTYQSIETIKQAQDIGLPEFNLAIADEAHRTVGTESKISEDAKARLFSLINKQDYIKATKRLYMTATPKVYTDALKRKTNEYDFYSMDDELTYGKAFYRLDFGRAVRKKLLSDYKVTVMFVPEDRIKEQIDGFDAHNPKDKENAIMVGTYQALHNQGKGNKGKRLYKAVAFCSFIGISERLERNFQIANKNNADWLEKDFRCEVRHVDGTQTANERAGHIAWLKKGGEETSHTCHILSNAKCLSEGVDVPALDAIAFIAPYKSQVDIIQAIGRVMRKAEGKQEGYVILPVFTRQYKDIDSLDEPDYQKVIQALKALRSHDKRIDIAINHLQRKANGEVIEPEEEEDYPTIDIAQAFDDLIPQTDLTEEQIQGNLAFDKLKQAIVAKIVEKVGSKRYWDIDGKNLAEFHPHIVAKIQHTISQKPDVANAFNSFLANIRKTISDNITSQEAVDILAQDLAVSPIFIDLFGKNVTVQDNPVWQGIHQVTKHFEDLKQEIEEKLGDFYDSVKGYARGAKTAKQKQELLKDLYEKFFKNAFAKDAERLGVAYTPIELVDFTLRSVNHILSQEFGRTLGDKNVPILDPFTGTGSFISRLLNTATDTTTPNDPSVIPTSHFQSRHSYPVFTGRRIQEQQSTPPVAGEPTSNPDTQNTQPSIEGHTQTKKQAELAKQQEQDQLIDAYSLKHKYLNEIWANEINILPYYMAEMNIEASYFERAATGYQNFQGLVLTDTFKTDEKTQPLEIEYFSENNERRDAQNQANIQIIVGNPPWSRMQRSENDANKNIVYENLDHRIRQTYAETSNQTNMNALYDSYVRAIRWASDRIKDQGIIGLVTNGGFIDGNVFDGFRKSVAKEFTDIYVVHCRGNIRAKMLKSEYAEKEGENVFGVMVPVAVTIFVKNPHKHVDSGLKASTPPPPPEILRQPSTTLI